MMIEVIDGGIYTTVQDFPGRVGYWDIGIPPSGPMDDLALKIANRLVGNAQGAAGLEITTIGPTLKFTEETTIACAGAELHALLDNEPFPWLKPVSVKPGQVLHLKNLKGAGYRACFAVAGGIDVPDYLGSKSTFPYGNFGGYQGRPLKAGDQLSIGKESVIIRQHPTIPEGLLPEFSNYWEVGVVPGPHTAPDYFTLEDVSMFYRTDWQAHHQSNRLGYRLIGPQPKFTRKDGGEGGRHPSNLHDYVYSIGTLNFTGDMPIILNQDGPSLGGFVCIATIISSELWKIGQVKPGNKIRFKKLSIEEAMDRRRKQEALLATISVGA